MRYAGPVIDAHHHFWQPALGKQPWLRPDALIPFRYGDYSALKVAYLPDDLRQDASSINLVGSITMETEWELDDPLGEMEYTEEIQRVSGLPHAAVAHAVLAAPDVDGTLEALAARRIVRGVRNKPGQSAAWPGSASDSLLGDAQWQRGYKLLARHGLNFDLQVAWWNLHDAFQLMRRHEGVPVILNHTGLPVDRSAEGIEGWARALTEFAQLDHASLKISGLGTPSGQWPRTENAALIERAVEIFGVDRVMFASNFPVDSLVASYSTIYSTFLDASETWSLAEQQGSFALNAARIYRLDCDQVLG